MSFIQRLIDVSFILGQGAFGESGTDTVNVSGLRTSVKIVHTGGRSISTMDLEIHGLTQSLTNQLSTLGQTVFINELRQNRITVTAGDINGMSVVFMGGIINAWADYGSMPDVVFRVHAQAISFGNVQLADVSSFPGVADVATIMSGLATQLGLQFENNGVDIQLTTPYFGGSILEQVRTLAEHANISWIIQNGVLAIWVPGSSRANNGITPVISSTPGDNSTDIIMVGYPTYLPGGVMVKALFDPSILFGGTIQVNSSLDPATGQWIIFDLALDLESQVPNGRWFMDIQANKTGFQSPA